MMHVCMVRMRVCILCLCVVSGVFYESPWATYVCMCTACIHAHVFSTLGGCIIVVICRGGLGGIGGVCLVVFFVSAIMFFWYFVCREKQLGWLVHVFCS
jgi:hypothetical protein